MLGMLLTRTQSRRCRSSKRACDAHPCPRRCNTCVAAIACDAFQLNSFCQQARCCTGKKASADIIFTGCMLMLILGRRWRLLNQDEKTDPRHKQQLVRDTEAAVQQSVAWLQRTVDSPSNQNDEGRDSSRQGQSTAVEHPRGKGSGNARTTHGMHRNPLSPLSPNP